MFSKTDAMHMATALKLAEKGRFFTSPNPNVGCVITNAHGEVVGQGYHHKAGQVHAEVNALNDAGAAAKGATAYVTLEPCSHHGKTPPCVDAIIKAGISRVVVAMEDPNPKVSGRGFSNLRDAGIQVDVGLMEDSARALNPGFIKRHQTGLPAVTLKMAMSLDGKTALANGQSQWITAPAARQDVQKHRAESCAILTGSGTVLVDNPALNVRPEELPPLSNAPTEGNIRQPLRVLLDGRNQLRGPLKVFADDNIMVVNLSDNPHLTEQGVRQWQAPVSGEKINLDATLRYLGKQQLNNVWLEAGSKLAGAFLEQQLVDRIIVYIAPKLMGHTAFSLLNLEEFSHMSEVPQLIWQDVRQVGEDLKLTASVQY